MQYLKTLYMYDKAMYYCEILKVGQIYLTPLKSKIQSISKRFPEVFGFI